MKTSDICVGDWVNYKSPSSGKLRPIKIENIYGAEFNCEVENWNIISGRSISDTEPIPLTSDILVKNGFDKDERSKYFHVYTLNIKGSYDFDICWSSVNGFNYEGDLMLTYVHQLQHLLRLCGIEKELVID